MKRPSIDETRAVTIARALVRETWNRELKLLGARRDENLADHWAVNFRTALRTGPAGATVDGPTIVLVNTETGEARFFVGP